MRYVESSIRKENPRELILKLKMENAAALSPPLTEYLFFDVKTTEGGMNAIRVKESISDGFWKVDSTVTK